MTSDDQDHELNFESGLGASPETWWLQQSARYDWAQGSYFQRMEMSRCTPEMMDALWADGWRHFGTTFFRDYFNLQERRLVRVLPLRVRLSNHHFARDQRRIIKRNQDLKISFKPIVISSEHEELFKRHALRFQENRPESISDFISLSPLVPCLKLMCEIRKGERLVAASFFDVGREAISSIYAMFDPEEGARGLGHLTLIAEIKYAIASGKQFVYTGYAHKGSSYYDYKKRYRGSEFYDWREQWRPWSELSDDLFPTHRYEVSDIPPELLNVETDETDETDDLEEPESL